MEDLANDYAGALEDGFGGPVDVLGISTGGSLAPQLAADRPGLVRRLVVAGAACRLSEHGRAFQRRVAELSAARDRRGLSRMQAPDVADSPLGRRVAGGLLWLAGSLLIRRRWDPSDMISTIEAEDDFDIKDRLREIRLAHPRRGRGRDPSKKLHRGSRTPASSSTRTAHGGTFADRRFGKDVVAFLKDEHPAPR
jgi:pimeloyl-ACP methyl ester carboxylesterase